MPMREAAPRPIRKPSEKLKAPGGKSNATPGSNRTSPVAITTSVVTSVPTHKLTVIFAIDVMRRYSRAMLRRPTAPAIRKSERPDSPGQM